MKIPIADRFPKIIRWYPRYFDRLQFWLINHHVCMRHQEHKIYHLERLDTWPTREEGLRLPDEGFPVIQLYSVGVPSWVLPKINIIDLWGLNDYVIARIPVKPGTYRAMAHDRVAPKEYVNCFSPNVRNVPEKGITFFTRVSEFSAENIIACEKKWFNIVREGYIPPKPGKKGKPVKLK
jgi:arabinofuranosyltransferase